MIRGVEAVKKKRDIRLGEMFRVIAEFQAYPLLSIYKVFTALPDYGLGVTDTDVETAAGIPQRILDHILEDALQDLLVSLYQNRGLRQRQFHSQMPLLKLRVIGEYRFPDLKS